MADTKDSGDYKESPAKESTHDDSQEMNLPPQQYLAAERATMMTSELTHVVHGQKSGDDQLQYSYNRPESGMMWFGGGSDYSLRSSSPTYNSLTSSMGTWSASGQKRTRSEETGSSSETQFSGQKLQRGIIQDSSSLSSGLFFFHN